MKEKDWKKWNTKQHRRYLEQPHLLYREEHLFCFGNIIVFTFWTYFFFLSLSIKVILKELNE